jgi:hypothetical protein
LICHAHLETSSLERGTCRGPRTRQLVPARRKHTRRPRRTAHSPCNAGRRRLT